MALPKAGVSLVVENDKAFKDALSEVNSGLRVNKSELQLVTAQTQNLDDRQAALQARYQAVENTLQKDHGVEEQPDPSTDGCCQNRKRTCQHALRDGTVKYKHTQFG